jgi:hypothetical protein
MKKISISLTEALKFFGFKAVPEIGELKAEYRRRSLLAHPDVGGKQEDFLALQTAYLPPRKELLMC